MNIELDGVNWTDNFPESAGEYLARYSKYHQPFKVSVSGEIRSESYFPLNCRMRYIPGGSSRLKFSSLESENDEEYLEFIELWHKIE